MPDESKVIILVVEDDEICGRLIIRQLKHLGFTAHWAVNGQEALEVLAKNSYGFILMDLQMPVMGGIEATRAIRHLEQGTKEHIPIVAVTANPDRDLCLKSGMDDFIFKPASLDDLRAILNRWLPQHEILRTAIHQENNLEEFARLRLAALEERRITQQEREIIQMRRNSIEQRRKSLATDGSESSMHELLDLKCEVINLHDRICKLHVTTIMKREEFSQLSKRAHSLWHDFSLLPEEESQLRQERIQDLAESVQNLHEEVQQQEEDREKRDRQKKRKQESL